MSRICSWKNTTFPASPTPDPEKLPIFQTTVARTIKDSPPVHPVDRRAAARIGLPTADGEAVFLSSLPVTVQPS
jgi:hypothetical protein